MNEYHEKVRITKRYPKNSENDPISGKIRTSEENQKDLQISEVFLVFRKIWPPWWRYKVPEEYFPPEDLRYINHILHELDLENSKEHMKQIESLEHPRRLPSSEYPNDKDDNRSSSTSSSVPEGRSAFAMDCYFEKDGFMNEWLDHGELKGNLLNEY